MLKGALQLHTTTQVRQGKTWIKLDSLALRVKEGQLAWKDEIEKVGFVWCGLGETSKDMAQSSVQKVWRGEVIEGFVGARGEETWSLPKTDWGAGTSHVGLLWCGCDDMWRWEAELCTYWSLLKILFGRPEKDATKLSCISGWGKAPRLSPKAIKATGTSKAHWLPHYAANIAETSLKCIANITGRWSEATMFLWAFEVHK